jgi:hypothetical protein
MQARFYRVFLALAKYEGTPTLREDAYDKRWNKTPPFMETNTCSISENVAYKQLHLIGWQK